MKLSTKGRYGLKAMFDLALNFGDGPISLACIAERQNISLNYLEQLISPLRKSELVKSVRGAQGGYMLAKEPSMINVGEILTVLEGSLAPVDCLMDHDDDHACEASDVCCSRTVYELIYEKINEVVYSITLNDMIEDFKAKGNTDFSNIKCGCK